MYTSIKLTTLAALPSVSALASAAAEAPANPYAGQEARAIKSLADQDVTGLLASKGAALTKAAELNGYPGPAHVLELPEPQHLDISQVEVSRQHSVLRGYAQSPADAMTTPDTSHAPRHRPSPLPSHP